MSNKTIYEQLIEDKEFERLMAQEDFIMDVTENFCEILENEDISRTKLAKLIGRTKGFVSQILNGGRNLTLRTMVDVAFCLGYEIELKFNRKLQKKRRETFRVVYPIYEHKNCEYLESANASDDYAPPTCDLSGVRVAV